MGPNSKPKSAAVGPNFTSDITWKPLILLSLSKKRPRNMFLYKVISRPLQFASRGECTTVLGILLATFFWDTLYIWPPLYRALCLLGGRLPTWPTSPLPPSASVALGNRQGGAASMSVRIQIPPPFWPPPIHFSCMLAVMVETENFLVIISPSWPSLIQSSSRYSWLIAPCGWATEDYD